MEFKTNVMRLLDKKKVQYSSHCYVDTPTTNGIEIARILHQDPKQVFKTLVTVSKSRKHFVFVLPVEKELNLKKAAYSIGEKAVDMFLAIAPM